MQLERKDQVGRPIPEWQRETFAMNGRLECFQERRRAEWICAHLTPPTKLGDARPSFGQTMHVFEEHRIVSISARVGANLKG